MIVSLQAIKEGGGGESLELEGKVKRRGEEITKNLLSINEGGEGESKINYFPHFDLLENEGRGGVEVS